MNVHIKMLTVIAVLGWRGRIFSNPTIKPRGTAVPHRYHGRGPWSPNYPSHFTVVECGECDNVLKLLTLAFHKTVRRGEFAPWEVKSRTRAEWQSRCGRSAPPRSARPMGTRRQSANDFA
eukprot:825037-Pyramimonas_sp.AAC.2